MSLAQTAQPQYEIKKPKGLSQRITWLRDYYFEGSKRSWNNDYTAWTTGESWDVLYEEMNFYIVPETYAFFQTFSSSFLQAARRVDLPGDFWRMSLPERRAWFMKEVMVGYVPVEVLPGDLIAGARFNVMASRCWNKKEAKERDKLVRGKDGARAKVKWFHDHGYGNAGATAGHVIPGYEKALTLGWKGIYAELAGIYDAMGKVEKQGPKGDQVRAMMTAATLPRDLAARYAAHCRDLAEKEPDPQRGRELIQMADNLSRAPWEPPETFWEAVQALWLTHMLVLSDENYPGAGVSFGRIDQYLLPYWRASRWTRAWTVNSARKSSSASGSTPTTPMTPWSMWASTASPPDTANSSPCPAWGPAAGT